MLTILQQYISFFFISTTLVGLYCGGFITKIIYRLPILLLDETYHTTNTLNKIFIHPASYCPHCKHPLHLWESIPIFSFVLQKGLCKYCQHRIPWRYPLTEIFSGFMTLMLAWHFGPSNQFLAALVLSFGLLTASIIDLDHQFLPDIILLPLLWLGLLINLHEIFTTSASAIIGAIAGYVCLWSVAFVFRLITGQEGMGHGDFKLLALLGAWLGWQFLPLTVCLASLLGVVGGLGYIFRKGYHRYMTLAFGPYLAIAGWISLLWGHSLMRIYLQIL